MNNVAYFLSHRNFFLTVFLFGPPCMMKYIIPLLYLLIVVGAGNKIHWFCSSFKIKEIY